MIGQLSVWCLEVLELVVLLRILYRIDLRRITHPDQIQIQSAVAHLLLVLFHSGPLELSEELKKIGI